MKQHWALDPDVTFLNHGAFGACPLVVQAVADEVRARLEREPVHFFAESLPPALGAARESLGAFVGADPDDLAFVENATAGVNTVLRSLAFGPGDALLTTDHAYNACRNVLEYVADRTGARVVVAKVPLPVAGPDDVVEHVLAAVTPDVRLALVDHVTSPTGLVFPIERIVRALAARGVDTLVDGAHAPGMLPLDVESIGAAYYTGNLHKWVCAPRGAAFLWVRRDLQARIHPLVISHGYRGPAPRSRYVQEFSWVGVRDPAPWLAVPAAIQFLAGLLPGGIAALQDRNRELALAGRRMLERTLGASSLAPETMIGSLASVALPDGAPDAPTSPDLEPLHLRLLQRHRIQVPVFTWPEPPRRLVRISAQAYTTIEEVRRLERALVTELAPAAT